MKFGKKQKERSILCIGLDNAGKTTLIHQMKPKKALPNDITPTVGFTVEEFKACGTKWKMYDMSGQGRYRNLWGNFFNEVEGIIYVVDTTDQLRLCVAREELKTVMESPSLVKVPVLVLGNKTDIPGATPVASVTDTLDLPQLLSGTAWNVIGTSGTSGDGVEEGLRWLLSALP